MKRINRIKNQRLFLIVLTFSYKIEILALTFCTHVPTCDWKSLNLVNNYVKFLLIPVTISINYYLVTYYDKSIYGYYLLFAFYKFSTA